MDIKSIVIFPVRVITTDQVEKILSFKVKNRFQSVRWATQFTLINHLKHSILSPTIDYHIAEPITNYSLSLYTLCVHWYRYGSANRSSR